MNNAVLMGDIHGPAKFPDLRKAAEGSLPVIQIGDFGFGFGGDFDREAEAFLAEADGHVRFIRGNHDNPAVCRSMPGFIEDGTVEGDTMFIGGAWSIDWQRRTKDVDWWADEEVSQEEFDRLLGVYREAKPDVMVTHDGPDCMFGKMFGYDRLFDTRTGRMLSRFLNAHQPEFWIFGHHHRSAEFDDVLSGTLFRCLGEGETMEIEL